MDDILNIEIDPALLLSYELDKLNLDNIASDIFEFSDEIPKNGDNFDDENALRSHKTDEDSKEKHILESESSVAEDKPCAIECKLETSSRKQKRKKDINDNEEPSSCEKLNQLFDNLELSDSDNEADEDCPKLKERGPTKTQSRAKKNRDKTNVLIKSKSHDKSQFNPQSLKFWSGSSEVKLAESNTVNQFLTNHDLTSIYNSSNTVPTIFSQDYFYGDARATAVSSPESGYESSSALSGSSSPPLLPLSTSYSLDFIPETVDEQNILEFLAENTAECALTQDLSVSELDDKDAKGKIIDIINYLKEVPEQLNESPLESASPDNTIQEHVPLFSNTQDGNSGSPLRSPNTVLKNRKTPKKLVFKLNDEAKNALRKSLPDDEFHATEKRIYRKVWEDSQKQKVVKVIYVEDESKNRTNLHNAVLDSKLEDILCLVEIHKQYKQPLTDINIRDKDLKTALDYAVDKKMKLVIDYLMENTACQSVNI